MHPGVEGRQFVVQQMPHTFISLLLHFQHPGEASKALRPGPSERHMAVFLSNHVHQIAPYVLMSRS